MIRRVVGIHFSPIGGTAGMTDRLTKQLAAILEDCSPDPVTTETYALLSLDDEDIVLDEETIAVIGMPVYVGKVPVPALRALRRISGAGTLAVTAVSYGARSYGNALYELQHHAEEQGFKVIGAGAFSVRHKTNGFRPAPGQYIGDAEAVDRFGTAAAAKIKRLAGCEIDGLKIKPAPLDVDGRLPIHRISKVSPNAAAVAQGLLEKLTVKHKSSEWFL